MTKIAFLDLETTGLDPLRHTITEVGLILPEGEEIQAWIKLEQNELAEAEPQALKINHYYDRRIEAEDRENPDHKWTSVIALSHRREFALSLCEDLQDCILAGCNVKFDQQFLEIWMREQGVVPVWDYRVLDVPTYAAGVHNAITARVEDQIEPPFSTAKICNALGIESDEGLAHSALYDAQLGQRIWNEARSK